MVPAAQFTSTKRQNAPFWLLILALMLMLGMLAASIRPAAAATPVNSLDYTALDTYITAQMKKHGLKGIALAVTEGDEILYLKGYGTAGQNRPMTAQTPMYIGSHSKSITGLAIAQLVDQGKIALNAPVQKYIPWFRVADPDASQKITISHLLHHTSGLSESGYTNRTPDDASLAEGVRALSTARLTAPVGMQFQYFNLNFSVLALVIETVTGQSYADYVQQHIFTPLQMTHTYTDPATARANGLSQGYSRFLGFTVPWPQHHPTYELANGFLISSAEDLAHYAIALNNQGVYQGASVLPPEKLKLLFAPIQGYGMGWFVEPGHYHHGGANETFKTFVDLYPERGLGVILLINQGYMIDHYISAEQISRGVQAIVLGTPPPPVSEGWSVRTINQGVLVLVLALSIFHTRNLFRLRTWADRMRGKTALRRAVDIVLSFLIPLVILGIVFWQVKNFLSYRFNFTDQIDLMFRVLPDIGLVLLLTLIPDFIQGFYKLYAELSSKTRPH